MRQNEDNLNELIAENDFDVLCALRNTPIDTLKGKKIVASYIRKINKMDAIIDEHTNNAKTTIILYFLFSGICAFFSYVVFKEEIRRMFEVLSFNINVGCGVLSLILSMALIETKQNIINIKTRRKAKKVKKEEYVDFQKKFEEHFKKGNANKGEWYNFHEIKKIADPENSLNFFAKKWGRLAKKLDIESKRTNSEVLYFVQLLESTKNPVV